MGYIKKSLIGVGVLAITALTSISANASLLIEPHLGYIVSGGVSSWENAKYDYTGPQLGARLGVQYFGLMGGFDYTHSNFSLNVTPNGQSKMAIKQKQDELGVFVGYSAPILLRAWVGYYFSTKITETETVANFGTDGDYLKGKTTEIGLGFTPLPLINLNLVYRMLSFDKLHNAGNGTDRTLSPKYEPKELVLGISLPFTLL